MKKNQLIIFFLVLFFNVLFFQNAVAQKKNEISKSPTNQEIEDYFIEIALGSEFGKGKNVRKWRKNIKYFVPTDGVFDNELTVELTRIVAELNTLIGGKPLIKEVDSREEANFVVFFGKSWQYVQDYEPKAKDLAKKNWGLFWTSIDKDGFITKGTMYVDTERIKTIKEQKHVLREEFTQALGLMNDSYKYKNSIFQQDWTSVNEYMPIDRKIIQLLYDSRIKAGMTATRARTVVRQILNPTKD